jgi:hypothetical protein
VDLPPPPPAVPPPADGPRRLARAALAMAWASLLLYGVAALLLVIPVEVPEVQDCGTPVSYLLEGPVDVVPTEDGRFLDEQGEVVTLDADATREARDRPCRERIAALAVPAAALIVVATLVGLTAFVVELFVVRPRQRRALAAARDDAAPRDPATDVSAVATEDRRG